MIYSNKNLWIEGMEVKKKILMISSTWNNSYIQELLAGMKKKLKSVDAELYVFNAYDEALESEYHRMERSIYFLPDVEKFDGVLLAVNSVGNQSVVNELAQYYREKEKRVLSLELKFDNVSSIGTDNYKAEYELVEHLITVHGCKTFNYVGGPEEHKENGERYRAFCDCLAAHGLEVEPRRVVNYSFREVDGPLAYQHFKEMELHLPDAVVCANDHMALGYCTAAAEDGFVAPDDFKITGFDYIQDGKDYYPSITSVDRCWSEIGYESITRILEMIDGAEFGHTYFQGKNVRINESCGCSDKQRDFHKDLMEVHAKKLIDEQMRTFERKSRKLLCGSVDMKDFQKRLQSCQEAAGLEKMAICLNPSAFSKSLETKMSYDDEFEVYDGTDVSKMKRKDSLIPEAWKDKHSIYFFSPLHFGQINFGYCVLAYSEQWQKAVDHRNLMESICLGLEGIRQHANLRRVNARLEELYVRDAMTGMYNRFGYERIAKDFFDRQDGKIYACYLDLDNLKMVNDTYGHEIGDQAIHGLANGITYAFENDSIQVRMGGDEFLVIGVYQNEEEIQEKEEKLHTYLKVYSISKNFPFALDVSIGHTSNEKGQYTLEQMIQEADMNMYRIKQSKKYK